MRKKITGKLKFIVLIVLLVAGTAALLHSHVKQVKTSPVMDAAPWALFTDSVRQGKVTQGFPALGKVVTSTEVRIVPQISGTVLKMGPRAGGRVHKGDLIVHLDTRTLESEAGSLKAKLASAVAVEKYDRKEMKRQQRLKKTGDSSLSKVQQYETRVRSDEASIQSLKQQLETLRVKISYGHILSPIDGYVATRLAEPGDAVFVGKPVYTLTAQQGGRVVVPVPLDTVTRIKPGGTVILLRGKQKMRVSISRVNPSLDTLAMGSLEIDLPRRPFNLPNASPIAVRVLTATASGLTVPVNSLRPARKQAQRSLFKVEKPEAKPATSKPLHIKLIPVKIQLCGKQRCVIKGDLAIGDRVVTARGSVLLQLHDGDPIIATPVVDMPAIEASAEIIQP